MSERAMSLPTTRERHAKDQQYLAMQMADFIQQWSPQDAHERQRFEQETYFLFQRAQQLAQEPIMSAYTELADSMPMPHLMLKP